MTIFLSHRVEICHNATLGIDTSPEISAVLTILEKICLSSMQNPTVGTAKGTTMTQVAQILIGQPFWATPSEICHLLNTHSNSHLLCRERCHRSWLQVCQKHEQKGGRALSCRAGWKLWSSRLAVPGSSWDVEAGSPWPLLDHYSQELSLPWQQQLLSHMSSLAL